MARHSSAEIPDLGIHVKRFRHGQRLVWRRHVPARLCVILGGAMSELCRERELDERDSESTFLLVAPFVGEAATVRPSDANR